MILSLAVHGAAALALLPNLDPASTPGGQLPAVVDVNLVTTATAEAVPAAAAEATPDPGPDKTPAPASDPNGTTPAQASGSSGEPSVPVQVTDATTNGPDQPAAPALNGETADLYAQVLMEHIRRYRTYPMTARRDHIEGDVVLRFVVDRNGNVLDAFVETSSGTASLDAAALSTISRAQPLPPIPSTLPDRLSLTLPITFHLQSS